MTLLYGPSNLTKNLMSSVRVLCSTLDLAFLAGYRWSPLGSIFRRSNDVNAYMKQELTGVYYKNIVRFFKRLIKIIIHIRPFIKNIKFVRKFKVFGMIYTSKGRYWLNKYTFLSEYSSKTPVHSTVRSYPKFPTRLRLIRN